MCGWAIQYISQKPILRTKLQFYERKFSLHMKEIRFYALLDFMNELRFNALLRFL